ncbi:MAG: LysR family transcriptional regulator [Dysosmobacter sp.]|nr:LysR family transcriptional regulator [Dysosmobacter sp.]
MNMTDIACFIKVAECGSFTKASEELYISQQAVSLHIKHLENTYKTILFERRPCLKLTQSGKLLLDAATEIMQREALLMDELNVSRQDFRGELTIGLPANRSTAFACEFVPHFSSLYPNMSVRLEEQYSATLSADLVRNRIDLALPLISSTSARLDPAFLEIIPLEAETLYLIISDDLLQKTFPDRFPACKKQFRSGVSLYQFAHLPLFLHPSNSLFHREILNAIAAHGITPFIRIKTSLTSLLADLCAKGYGIFFSPSMMLKYMYETQHDYFNTLNTFPVIEYQGARQTFLAHHRQKQLTKPAQDAIEIIKKIYSEHQLFDQNIQRH